MFRTCSECPASSSRQSILTIIGDPTDRKEDSDVYPGYSQRMIDPIHHVTMDIVDIPIPLYSVHH